MKISLRRFPNGEPAPQRLVVRAEGRTKGPNFSCRVRKESAPQQEKSFIDALLGDIAQQRPSRKNCRFTFDDVPVLTPFGDERQKLSVVLPTNENAVGFDFFGSPAREVLSEREQAQAKCRDSQSFEIASPCIGTGESVSLQP